MEKATGVLVAILVVFFVGAGIFFIIDSKSSEKLKFDGQIPYSNVASGFFNELTPASILDNKDEEFWEINKLVKTQFFIESKFGQYKESDNLYNYTLSSSEDCEKEFDKKNFSVSNYLQTSNINPSKYTIYPARSCWIESVSPVKFECTTQEPNSPCLYSSKVSCVCVYGKRL